MNNPFNIELATALYQEYLEQAKVKGDSWLDDNIFDHLWRKFTEEYAEVIIAADREGAKRTKEELLDIMLVAGMLWRRLNK